MLYWNDIIETSGKSENGPYIWQYCLKFKFPKYDNYIVIIKENCPCFKKIYTEVFGGQNVLFFPIFSQMVYNKQMVYSKTNNKNDVERDEENVANFLEA